MVPTGADAAILWDQGANSTVIEYCEDSLYGSVVIRIETVMHGQTSDDFQVDSSIVEVKPAAGWKYRVKKAGGLDSAIEVEFTSGKQSATFKAVNVPGKTVINCGYVT